MSLKSLVCVLVFLGAGLIGPGRIDAQARPYICTSSCPTYPPTVSVSPTSKVGTGNVSVTVTVCDSIGVPGAAVTYNGASVTASFNFTQGTSHAGCHFSVVGVAALALQTGPNALVAAGSEFSSGNLWVDTVRVTYYGTGYNDAIVANPATISQNPNTNGSAAFNVTNTGYPADTFKITYTCTAHALTHCGPVTTDSLVLNSGAQGTASVWFTTSSAGGKDTIVATASRYATPTVAHSASAVITTVPPCCGTNPPPVITFTPSTMTDTLSAHVDSITICDAGYPPASDSAAFNGVPITGFVSNATNCLAKKGTYPLNVGANTFYVYACGSNHGGKTGTCGSVGLTVGHPALAIQPKGGTVQADAGVTIAQTFTVSNYTTTSQTYNFTTTCGGRGVSNCSTPAPLNVAAGSHQSVTMTYASNDTIGTSGTIQLKATASGISDSASATVNVAGGVTVSAGYTNQDDRVMSRCAQACFAGTASTSASPYISRDTPRTVTLVYNGDGIAVRPVVYADVSVNAFTTKPQMMQLRAQVNGTWATFTNGETTLQFADHIGADSTGPFRLAGAIVDTSLVTGAYALKIQVTVQYADHLEQFIDSSHVLAIVNTRSSYVARGWSIAGLPFIYSYYLPDGSGRFDQSRILLPTGDGTAIVYTMVNNGCNPKCMWTPPAGDFAYVVEHDSAGQRLLGYERHYPDSTEEVFNSNGYLTYVVSRNLVDTVRYTYDGSGRLTRMSDPYRTYNGAHTQWEIEYSAYGIDSIVEPGPLGQINQGRRTAFTVDTVTRLLKVVKDADAYTHSYGYDSQYRLDSVVDRKSFPTTYTYDTVAWKVASMTSPAVAIDSGSTGDTVSVHLVTRYAPWQIVGIPTGLTATTPATPVRADSVFASVTDAMGKTTRFTVDRWGQPMVKIDPLGLVTSYQRDINGFATQVTNPMGVADKYTYVGSLLTVSEPAGQSATNYHYGAFAQPDSMYGFGRPTMNYYFQASTHGRIDSTRVLGTPGVTAYTYDGSSRLTQIVDPLGRTSVLAYDTATGNTNLAEATPSQRFTKKQFDRWGRDSVVTVTGDHTLQQTTKLYDSMNRLVQVKDGVHSNAVVYQRDQLYLYNTIDLKNQSYRTTYNALGWPITQIDPAGQVTRMTYTARGEVATVTNGRVQVTRFRYDSVGRLTGIHRSSVRGEADAADSVWYSIKGDTIIEQNAVSIDRTYLAPQGWPDSTITTFPTHGTWYKRYYHHNLLGQVDSIAITTNGTGTALHARHFGWNSATSLLDSLWVGAGAATRMGYNGEYIHTKTTFPTGVTRTDTLSDINTVLASTHSGNVSGQFNRGYAYDSAGRIAEVDYPASTELMDYDALGHLNSRAIGTLVDSIPCTEQQLKNGYPCHAVSNFHETQRYSYGFDPAGNLDTLADSAHATTTLGAYGTGNTDSLWNSVPFTHDADGDRSTVNGAAATYLWSADGRLLQAISGTDTVAYDYNVRGQLVRRQKHGVDDRFYLWDNGQLIAILDQSAAGATTEYAYYPGTDQPFEQIESSTGVVSYFEQDASRNVIGLHANGAATQSLHYDPWGNLESVTPTTNDTTQLRWKGLLWEGGAAQLYQVRARWYDPATHRFISPDRLGIAAGINQYAFAAGDPENGQDPSGMLYYSLTCSPEQQMGTITIYNQETGEPVTAVVPVNVDCELELIDTTGGVPTGVYFGCRPIDGPSLISDNFGHCAVQTSVSGVVRTIQLIPVNFVNTFPSSTSEDDQFNWLVIPGADPVGVNTAADLEEALWKGQNYALKFLFYENSNTFACQVLKVGNVPLPAWFLSSPVSPLSSRWYPTLSVGGCIQSGLSP